MAKINLTAGRIEDFQCAPGKAQAFLWCAEVQGLAVRATTGSTRKRYIFESKVKGKTIRLTIGEVSVWNIATAQIEARRLQILIDQGKDPREVKANEEAAKEAEKLAKEKEAAALLMRNARESVTVAEAWDAYTKERTASIKDGKPEWGERHKAHHAYFAQAGGVKRKRGRRPNESETTRPGMLVPFMSLRLIDLDANIVSAWLKKEVAQAPTSAAKAFRFLRTFITWCTKNDEYSGIVHSDACHTESIKKLVPAPRTKKNDSLRRAQIRPWFEAVKKINNPVISVYL
ncbi:MAG: DUF4102 domain-containing protein, partial [Nitrosomonas sp.]|nr:DUF4102 domain-containing protein [Nitrosomonas sp.]